MANPLISQGTLNRLRGTVTWTDFPELNVSAPFLGKEAMRLSLEGEATTFIDTLTGSVTSPEPYMAVSLTLNLLKTQRLSDLYKRKMETSALLGSGTVRGDSAILSPYDLINCGIQAIRELNFSGDDAGFVVSIKGYYNINNALWG